jgi:hypothetical protein
LGPDRCAGAGRNADAQKLVALPGRRVDEGRVTNTSRLDGTGRLVLTRERSKQQSWRGSFESYGVREICTALPSSRPGSS